MAEENEFSSTMRIDIPPDLLAEAKPKSGKADSTKIRIRPPATQRISRSAVAAATASDTRFEHLLQGMYDAAIMTDLSGGIIDGNLRAADFLRYKRSEFQGLNILDIISGSDASLIDTLCQNVQNEKFTLIQAYCVRKDRTFFPAEIAVSLLRFDDPRLCFFVRDVTLRREAEEMLRTEHNAIQNAGNGIAIISVEAKLEYVNPALLKMWGFDRAEDILGKDVRAVLGETEESDKLVHSVLDDHESWSGELTSKKVSGEEIVVQVSAACNRDSDGEVVGMVASFVDISDRKRAEEALRQAERHRVMLASVGAACHHLGQPATVIMTNLELIKRMTSELKKEELNDLLKLTNEAAENMADVLHKLNSVEEYKTVQYLDARDAKSPENIILDI